MSGWPRPDKPGGYAAQRATGVGTTAGVTVTLTGTTGRRWEVTSIQCSGDAACVVTIESPASTILWRKRFAAAFTMSETFAIPLEGASGANTLVKVSASTANCEANIQGYQVAG